VQVDYVNVGKDTYLIEVSESLKRSVPSNYEMQSTKKVTRRDFSCIWIQVWNCTDTVASYLACWLFTIMPLPSSFVPMLFIHNLSVYSSLALAGQYQWIDFGIVFSNIVIWKPLLYLLLLLGYVLPVRWMLSCITSLHQSSHALCLNTLKMYSEGLKTFYSI
jgi:hypothetical protein